MHEAQGLRATSTGGHFVLYEAALAQLEPLLGHLFHPFNRMRVRRHEVEYAATENPEVTPEEVRKNLAKAHALIEDFALKAISLVSPCRLPRHDPQSFPAQAEPR